MKAPHQALFCKRSESYGNHQTAYEAAFHMIAERGKATVIHPTGTEKSFISFKLCKA